MPSLSVLFERRGTAKLVGSLTRSSKSPAYPEGNCCRELCGRRSGRNHRGRAGRRRRCRRQSVRLKGAATAQGDVHTSIKPNIKFNGSSKMISTEPYMPNVCGVSRDQMPWLERMSGRRRRQPSSRYRRCNSPLRIARPRQTWPAAGRSRARRAIRAVRRSTTSQPGTMRPSSLELALAASGEEVPERSQRASSVPPVPSLIRSPVAAQLSLSELKNQPPLVRSAEPSKSKSTGANHCMS